MIARARAWLDQWQLKPSSVPLMLIMLAATERAQVRRSSGTAVNGT